MRILVVGAGIMGLSAAEALLSAGHEVVVFEQGGFPNDLSSSSDQHRLIRHPYGDKLGYARLVDPAYAAWERLWERLGRRHYQPTGTLAVSRERGGWVDASAETLAEIGRPVDWLEADDLAARFPLLNIGPEDRGFHLESGGLLLARPILQHLAARLAMLRGSLNIRRRVSEIDFETGRLTLERGGDVSGDLILVTAGSWLPDLLGEQLPELTARITPSRQAYAYLSPPEETRAAWAAHPMVLDIGRESGFYLVPPAAGTGMKIGDHGFSLTGHPDSDRDARPEDLAESLAMAGQRLAGFERYQVESLATCFYTVEPEERFVAHSCGAAWILTGFSGHGFKFAPLIAEQLVEVVAGRMSAERFQGWISGQSGAMQDAAASPRQA